MLLRSMGGCPAPLAICSITGKPNHSLDLWYWLLCLCSSLVAAARFLDASAELSPCYRFLVASSIMMSDWFGGVRELEMHALLVLLGSWVCCPSLNRVLLDPAFSWSQVIYK
jgi:hypothetical protein